MRDDQLAAKPFHLDGAAIAWVRDTLKRLTPDEKIRQLFNLRLRGNDPADYAEARDFRPGSITCTPGPDWVGQRKMVAEFNAAAPVPLLVSADLEGSRMSLAGGAEFPNPLALAAIDDVAL